MKIKKLAIMLLVGALPVSKAEFFDAQGIKLFEPRMKKTFELCYSEKEDVWSLIEIEA